MPPFLPAAGSQSTFALDDLLQGDVEDVLSEKVTLLSGQANLKRGAVLGSKVTAATVAAPVADAGNTGNGTNVLAGTPFTATAKPGNYRIVALSATQWEVFDPTGIFLGHANNTVQFSNGIVFTITAGGTAFVPGDAWTVNVSALTLKYELAASAATDGSQTATRILANDCDATAGDKDALVFRKGTFNDSVLTYGAGHTAATVADSLRAQGIFLVHGQPALT